MNEIKQMTMLDELDYQEEQRSRIRERALRSRLEEDYVPVHEMYAWSKDVPDHTVLICESDRLSGNRIQHLFFRVVTGHHKTVSGPTMHIVSAPSSEWPDVPPWWYDPKRKCQWTYPDRETLWVRKEPETDLSAGWTETAGK